MQGGFLSSAFVLFGEGVWSELVLGEEVGGVLKSGCGEDALVEAVCERSSVPVLPTGAGLELKKLGVIFWVAQLEQQYSTSGLSPSRSMHCLSDLACRCADQKHHLKVENTQREILTDCVIDKLGHYNDEKAQGLDLRWLCARINLNSFTQNTPAGYPFIA
ncbi:hypothetical protein QAD02_002485 [Eretmocerus hayati]|uniref:Uncharacterized protein n=1 Tax=Eretmocerus hayati TaxID=131215 RepID=A0ACC2NJG5_9HYME|nr:hypothetical protein QAD02_002485 [Eretmocerus hayati]